MTASGQPMLLCSCPALTVRLRRSISRRAARPKAPDDARWLSRAAWPGGRCHGVRLGHSRGDVLPPVATCDGSAHAIGSLRVVRGAIEQAGQRRMLGRCAGWHPIEMGPIHRDVPNRWVAGNGGAAASGALGALVKSPRSITTSFERGLNRLCGRTGRVFGDRYHARALASPREVRNALCYVLNNARHHGEHHGVPAGLQRQWQDPFASGHLFDGWRQPRAGCGVASRPPPGEPRPVAAAETWLLCHGWRRHGLIAVDELPIGGARR